MTYYAATLALDGNTGDYPPLVSQRRKRGSPMIEVVKRVLRTPLGRYLPDKTFGVDKSVVQTARAGVQAAWKAAVEASLSRYVTRRQILNLVVTVDPPVKGRLFYQVEFDDPRATDNPQRLKQAT